MRIEDFNKFLKENWNDYFMNACRSCHKKTERRLIHRETRQQYPFCQSCMEQGHYNEYIFTVLFIVGDIFDIDGKEYMLRYINGYGGCWLEPVLDRNPSMCMTGGMNKICSFEELEKLDYLNVCY